MVLLMYSAVQCIVHQTGHFIIMMIFLQYIRIIHFIGMHDIICIVSAENFCYQLEITAVCMNMFAEVLGRTNRTALAKIC